MGIPKFFPWFKKHFPDNVLEHFYKDYFCIAFDLNQWIHCIKYENESDLAIKCYDFISFWQNKTKSKIVIIVMDGCCPYPKLEEQKERRKNVSFEKLQISVGTEFMKNFSFHLKKELKKLLHKCILYFSDSLVIGEGEHKIIELIVKFNFESTLIVSIDADTIMLCILNNLQNVDILRLYSDKFNIVVLNNINLPLDRLNFFINICLLGNDFLPKMLKTLNFINVCSENIFQPSLLYTGKEFSENVDNYVHYLEWVIIYYSKPYDGLTIPNCSKPILNSDLKNFSNFTVRAKKFNIVEDYKLSIEYQQFYIFPLCFQINSNLPYKKSKIKCLKISIKQ